MTDIESARQIGGELLESIMSKNLEIVKENPDYNIAELMATAALAGYSLGFGELADNIAVRITMLKAAETR